MKPAARLRVALIAFASLLLAFVTAAESHFAGKCPSDEAIIEWFHANRTILEDLLTVASEDDEKVTHVAQGVVELAPGTSLPEPRKQEYL
jgi:hypothetical protein